MPSITGPVTPSGIILQMTICEPGHVQRMMAAHTSETEGDKTISLAGFNALLDTGATRTCVSPAVIAQAGLKPFSRTIVQTAAGPSEVDQFQADVILQMGTTITFGNFTITEFSCPDTSPFQALLGMDIIMNGCLTISFDGRFTFSV